MPVFLVVSIQLYFFFCFFFFQAEDGIRDWSVTGVQTCALPISPKAGGTSKPRPTADERPRPPRIRRRACRLVERNCPDDRVRAGGGGRRRPGRGRLLARGPAEIGRASCRETAQSSCGGASCEE